MRKKIVGIFVCMLLISSVVTVVITAEAISSDTIYTITAGQVHSLGLKAGVPLNNPPVFGSPSPANGSTNNPISFTWSIPINDPEGNTFSWTMQCNNGQTNSGTGATNGTKSLPLSGLAYSTSYKVWVNATDPTGSGLWIRSWYTFTTKANKSPVFGAPSPANGSTGNLLSLTWSIPINDPEGNPFSWYIHCNNGNNSIGYGAINGTKFLVLAGLAYSTTYKVWVNATDPNGSGLWTRSWYTFTTKANKSPVFGTPSPANGSTGNLLSLTWSIPINDPEGDVFSWTIQCNNRQTIGGTGALNGTKSLELPSLTNSTTYKVWINATDPTGSGLYTRRWYTFTTIASSAPRKPTIDGPANGNVGVSYSYNFVTSDPEGDEVNYRIIWGDGSPVTEWYGPYHSGQVSIVTHTFLRTGTFIIQCQAKDSYNALSDWGQLDVIMPVSISINLPLFHQLIEKLFERFPHVFPMLKQLLGY